MLTVRTLLVLTLLLCAGCSSRPAPPAPATGVQDDFGVLVMAHGGSPEWNDGVLAVVEPLRDDHPVEVAFGMADAVSIQAAVRKLESRGVRRIGVVRMFISGESWYERTEQILGLQPGAPDAPAPTPSAGHEHHGADHAADHGASHGGHGGHSMEFWQIDTESSFALTVEGLAEAEASAVILADRARDLSRDPEREAVLILAHGPGDDAENERWIAQIDARADAVRALAFADVAVMTLREDWPDKRADAERRIRDYVQDAAARGLTPIVIPFRVQGFGPYAQVLEGLEYVSDGQGLVPHPEVTRWTEEQVEGLRQGSFRPGGPL